MKTPLLIAHRGASGYRPEHTLEAYELAIAMGADCIEPDLVMTRDGALLVRHENEIGGTTDVATRPEFAARRRRQRIDGVDVTGWFTEDFTLEEIRTLYARERLPQLRTSSRSYDGHFGVPTFADLLDWLAEQNASRHARGLAPIGVYPEIKHPSHFAALGLAMEAPLLALLARSAGAAPVYIQSFETGNLRRLRELTDYPLVQLVDAHGGPWDLRREDPARTYRELLSPAGLRDMARYATVLGANKELVIGRGPDGRLAAPTSLAASAHDAGLALHAWTFRAENEFLPVELRRGGSPAAAGDVESEIVAHLQAGLDGFFTDQPDAGRRAIERFMQAAPAPP